MTINVRSLTVVVRRRRDTGMCGQGGFSLIEVVTVVVVIGILTAIGLPMLVGLENYAEQSALQTAAATGAREAAAALLQGEPVNLAHLEKGSVASVTYADNSIAKGMPSGSADGVCVTATSVRTPTTSRSAGPGC